MFVQVTAKNVGGVFMRYSVDISHRIFSTHLKQTADMISMEELDLVF